MPEFEHLSSVLEEAEEGVGSPGGCELPAVSAGN